MSWWEETTTSFVLYPLIKCKLYQQKKFALPNTNLAKETDTNSYSVIVGAENTGIDKWMQIEIADWRWFMLGKFLIETVKFNKRIDWTPDHINLSVSKI